MKAKLEEIRERAKEELSKANAVENLEELRVKYAGKKGELTAILKQMGKLSPEERPVIGQLANEVRSYIDNAIETKKAELNELKLQRQLEEEKIDVTLPSNTEPPSIGPPGSRIAGSFSRAAAIRRPGTFLSQLGIMTSASN